MTVRRCRFEDNDAYANGGGWWEGGSRPGSIVEYCVFDGNSAASGGGLYTDDGLHVGYVSYSRCQFMGNAASEDGGGLFFRGPYRNMVGGIVENNTAGSRGGGVAAGANVAMVNLLVRGNRANYRGGGVAGVAGNGLSMANCVVVANTCTLRAGGIYSYAYSASFVNCTVAGNIAGIDSGGMYVASNTTNLVNSIVWGNQAAAGQPQDLYVVQATLQASYNDIRPSNLAGSNGNIDLDPRFVRAPDPGPDGQWDGINDDHGNLNLLADSPCIDAGDNTAVLADISDLDGDGNTTERTPLDLDGQPRFVDMDPVGGTGVADLPDYPHIVDMGAYEASLTTPADFDYDGYVDAEDLAIFASCSSGPAVPHDQTETCQRADFDDDNDVDQSDFGIFQRCYSGEGNPANPNCAD